MLIKSPSTTSPFVAHILNLRYPLLHFSPTSSTMMFKSTLLAFALFTSFACTAPVAQRAGDVHTGDATFFAPGLGACGTTNTDQDLMVAVSSQFFATFGAQSNGNPVCGRQIKATSPDGKSVTVTVQDKCPGCAQFDLDMSPAAFNQLADPSVGRLSGVTWELL